MKKKADTKKYISAWNNKKNKSIPKGRPKLRHFQFILLGKILQERI